MSAYKADGVLVAKAACKADGVLMAIPVISQADFACDIKYNNGYYRKQNMKAMEEEKLEQ